MARGFILLLLLLSMFKVMAKPHDVEVVAIQYPPFTDPAYPNNGIAFSMLNSALEDNQLIEILPTFLPPARAQAQLLKDDWCLSFYPPRPGFDAEYLPLSDTEVKLGFATLGAPAKWHDFGYFSGKKVAMLRTFKTSKLQQDLLLSGAEIVEIELIEQGFDLLLKQRVDFAFSDDYSLLAEQLSLQGAKLFFSESIVQSLPIGVHLNVQCPYANLIKASLKSHASKTH